ncbi:ABC transporter [Candidatus Roizmanbacteria bacterium CG_4_10_14_0_8_um_filter_33_9]|uniref:ABC transporter n=1 Tax=Candidatus Roizmanbacteria bacterium CG_4_10_14_0_8_um_filter_33_9 TaxID=1974826 RepID=A0A2M7QJM8_9BACT|nr:MAG: ABC transporter [Candidatus Roizmanbacteria bacterium CG_4_10_14_0_8_um_filter_33_9]
MIKVINLTKIYKTHIKQNNPFKDVFLRKYKDIVALDNVSFEIGEKESVGFIGPNGAGKTTTLKIISGILYPTSGFVLIDESTPFEKNPRFLKQIAFVMGQRNQLIWDLPATDTFELQKEIYEIPEQHYKKNVGELTDILKCSDLISKPVKTLSLGERMKMELIAGLLHRPKIVFFDEPTIGLDIFSQETIRTFIKQFQEEFKSTVILTSHYLEDVKKLSKRLIIINKGRIIYDGTLKKIIEQYSLTKRVTITLEKPANETELRAIDIPISYTFPKVVYKIKRSVLPEKIKAITQNLPFSDLSVEDETIEDIIKVFFKEQKR